MMTMITLIGGDHDDAVVAASVAGKCKVIGCPNPADAASPVTLHMSDYSRSIGQSADYRHNLTADLAAVHEAGAIVESYWDNDAQRWYSTVETIAAIDADAVQRVYDGRLAAARAAADRKQREENARRDEAVAAQRKEQLATTLDRARQLAEEWAPGRVSVWQAHTGRIFAGRWDVPMIPGYGNAAETRELIVRNGVLSLS